jgi:hypothetical protein
MALAWQNRATGDRRLLGRLYLLGAGLLLLLAATVATEHTQRWDMHQAHFYQVSTAVFLFFLLSASRASIARWPATAVAGVYTALTLVMVIVLPLFRAQPLLGPIYVQVDRFMPAYFPLLLIVPAFAIDLASQRLGGRINDWLFAAVAAIVFVAVFVAAQWPFADFLMSPYARNWFFVSDRMPYGADLSIQARWYLIRSGDHLARGLTIAAALGYASARCSLWWGNWMARVQR